LFLFEGGKTLQQAGYSLGLQLNWDGPTASATATASRCQLTDCHSTLYNPETVAGHISVNHATLLPIKWL